MTRLAGWEARLDAALAFHIEQRFAWGVSDCALMAWDAAAACFETMPMPRPAGYSTAPGAVRAGRRLGFADVGQWLAAGFPEIHPAMARRGDLGVTAWPDGELAACVFTSAGLLCKGPYGPQFLSPLAASAAFRIG